MSSGTWQRLGAAQRLANQNQSQRRGCDRADASVAKTAPPSR